MTVIPSKLTAQVIEKTVTEVGKQQQFNNLPEGGSPFQQMLDTMSADGGMVSELGLDNGEIGLPSYDVNAISAEGINVDTANLQVGLERPDGINKVVNLLSEVNDSQTQMQNMVNQILYSEKRFTNQELLAIQAHVFHFAQMTELVVKVADQGVSSVKSVLNTNIQ